MAKGLRKLGRRFPTPEEVRRVFGTLAEESDRSFAIMVGALLDGMAEKLLVQRMTNRDPENIKRLFEDRGPLSSLDSKILMSVAFDVIPEGHLEDMRLVRNIRNVFAHAAGNISFETAEIQETMRQTTWAKSFAASAADFQSFVHGRGAFSAISTWLLMSLSDLHMERGGESLIEIVEVKWGE